MRRNVQLYLGEHGREGVHSPGGHPGILPRQVRGRTEVCLYKRARWTVDVRACQRQVLAHHFNLVLLFDIKMSRESVLKNPVLMKNIKKIFSSTQVWKAPLRSGTRRRTAPSHRRRPGGTRTPRERGRGGTRTPRERGRGGTRTPR